MVNEVVCGPVQIIGAKVEVPRVRYDSVIGRLSSLSAGKLASFLMTRCDRHFIERFVQANPEFFLPLRKPDRFSIYMPLGTLAIYIAGLDLLPDNVRRDVAINVAETVKASGNLEPLVDTSVTGILTVAERLSLEEFATGEFLNRFDTYLEYYEHDWDRERDPEDVFSNFSRSLDVVEEIRAVSAETRESIDNARASIEDAIDSMNSEYIPPHPDTDDEYDDIRGGSVGYEVDASIFSDVAE